MDADFEESRMIANRSINFQVDADFDWSSRRVLVGFGFAPLCLIFKFQGMSRRWKLFHYKHSCHLFINIQFTWKGELSDSARSYGQHFQKDLLYARSVDSRKNYTFNYFLRACWRLKWKKKKKLAMITKVLLVQ